MDSIISELIDLGCFKIGSFILKSGKKSKFYIDLRCLVSYPHLLIRICNMMNNFIKDYNGLICGMPYSGIPFSQTISVLFNKKNLLLRKERKKHGTSKMIEGMYNKNDELVIIDDILTTGQSIVESLEHFTDFRIKKIIVIVDRNEGGKERLQSLGYSVESLFSINDFIQKN